MDNARKTGLGFLFAIIGFFIGRTYLPATPDRALALSSFTTRVAPATTPVPVAPAVPGPFAPAPAMDPNALPTPYPTPATLNDTPGVTTAPVPAPIRVSPQAPSQGPSQVPAPVYSNPGSYPTPYPTPPTPVDQPAKSTAPPAMPPGTMVNHVQALGPAPAAFSLDSFDRQSHLIYLVLALLAIGIIYKKRSNDAAVCVAMLIIGIVLGHYVDPGPINFANPFNKTV